MGFHDIPSRRPLERLLDGIAAVIPDGLKPEVGVAASSIISRLLEIVQSQNIFRRDERSCDE
jgi:hypothetical protein